MRTLFTWIVLIVVLVGGAYFGSPWWTVWNLERAAKAGDAHAVAAAVDFPAVRASLSPRLADQLQTALAHEQQKPHNLLEKFTLFATKLFSPKPADALVTPEGVTWMLKTASPPPWTNPFLREKTQPPGQPHLSLGHSGYIQDDLDQFQATLDNRVYPGRLVTLKLLRRGFISWKVVGLDLERAAGSSASYAPANTTSPN